MSDIANYVGWRVCWVGEHIDLSAMERSASSAKSAFIVRRHIEREQQGQRFRTHDL